MNQLETFLQSPLPLGEAASFFVRLKGGEKTASTEQVLAQLDALSEEEQEEVFKIASLLVPAETLERIKKANGMMGAAPQLPAAAKGNVMPAPPPVQLPATAMGQNSGAPKLAAKSDPAEVGKARGEANTASYFERERHRHGERTGTTLGRVAGLAAGAAVGHKIGKGNPLVDIAGAALGQHVGAGLGRNAGKAHDEHAYNKKHASAFKLALEGMGMQPAAGQQNLQSPPGVEPQLTPEMQEYLAQEQAADTAGMQAELEHARQALAAAMQAQQAAETKAQQLETQQQMTDSQLSQYQAQVADATQKAMMSQDEVLQQQQAAAAMRMAYQQLRGQLLQAASVDPPSLSGNEAALAAASTAAGPSSGPSPTQGAADQAPSPGTAPNSAAPTGDDQVSARSQTSQQSDVAPTTAVGQKEPQDGSAGRSPGKESLASALLPFVDAEKVATLRDFLSNTAREAFQGAKAVAPHAAVGGLIGGGLGFAESRANLDPLRQKIEELEAKGSERGTRDAISLATARGRLTVGEHAKEHPVASTLTGALAGATLGAKGGPGLVHGLQTLAEDVPAIGRNIKSYIQNRK